MLIAIFLPTYCASIALWTPPCNKPLRPWTLLTHAWLLSDMIWTQGGRKTASEVTVTMRRAGLCPCWACMTLSLIHRCRFPVKWAWTVVNNNFRLRDDSWHNRLLTWTSTHHQQCVSQQRCRLMPTPAPFSRNSNNFCSSNSCNSNSNSSSSSSSSSSKMAIRRNTHLCRCRAIWWISCMNSMRIVVMQSQKCSMACAMCLPSLLRKWRILKSHRLRLVASLPWPSAVLQRSGYWLEISIIGSLVIFPTSIRHQLAGRIACAITWVWTDVFTGWTWTRIAITTARSGALIQRTPK